MIQLSLSIECRGSLFATKSRCSDIFFFSHAEVLSWISSIPNMSGVCSVDFCFLPIREAGEKGLWQAIPLGVSWWSTALPCLCLWWSVLALRVPCSGSVACEVLREQESGQMCNFCGGVGAATEH